MNYYIDADELKGMIPTMGINKCRKFINEVRKQMAEKNYFVPSGKKKLALRSMVFENLGIKTK